MEVLILYWRKPMFQRRGRWLAWRFLWVASASSLTWELLLSDSRCFWPACRCCQAVAKNLALLLAFYLAERTSSLLCQDSETEVLLLPSHPSRCRPSRVSKLSRAASGLVSVLCKLCDGVSVGRDGKGQQKGKLSKQIPWLISRNSLDHSVWLTHCTSGSLRAKHLRWSFFWLGAAWVKSRAERSQRSKRATACTNRMQIKN